MKHWIGKIGSNVLFETNLFYNKINCFSNEAYANERI